MYPKEQIINDNKAKSHHSPHALLSYSLFLLQVHSEAYLCNMFVFALWNSRCNKIRNEKASLMQGRFNASILSANTDEFVT